MDARPRRIVHYLTAEDTDPFSEWMEKLRGQQIHGIILNRLDRVARGNLGDWGPVGEGVSELYFRGSGPAYRVYFAQDGNDVVLLTGGTKKTQPKDIRKAREYWRDYNA